MPCQATGMRILGHDAGMRSWLVGLLLVAGCARPARTTTLDSIPRAAADAIRGQAGGARIEEVERESEEGEELYEAKWSESGRRHELTVNAAGQVFEHEIEVPEVEVPAPVRATAQRELGAGATWEKTMLGRYKAEVGDREVVIDADGAVIGRDKD